MYLGLTLRLMRMFPMTQCTGMLLSNFIWKLQKCIFYLFVVLCSYIHRYTAQPLVQTVFDRGMATCFAYGPLPRNIIISVSARRDQEKKFWNDARKIEKRHKVGDRKIETFTVRFYKISRVHYFFNYTVVIVVSYLG